MLRNFLNKARNKSRLVSTVLLNLLIINVVGCTSESQPVAEVPQLTSQQHDQLLLKTKHAMLALDLSQVDKLSSTIDVNRALPDNSSLLAWAVETQTPELVSLLLDKGATADIANGNRFSPMILACRYGNPDIINALLDHGGNPNSAIDDGTTAFQLCAGSASTDILARMINEGARISAANSAGQTALMWAANFGNTANLNFLIEAGADINAQTQQGYSPLFFAIKSQNLDTVKTAISSGANVFATANDGTTAAQLGVYTHNYAFLTWYVSELDLLMSPGAINTTLTAFDREGYQLLHAAVIANQPELVSALLARGANPNQISQPSSLKWRYEANFKTEAYLPPQQTPVEIAEQQQLDAISAVFEGWQNSQQAQL